jgi:hypothetical protein
MSHFPGFLFGDPNWFPAEIPDGIITVNHYRLVPEAAPALPAHDEVDNDDAKVGNE